MYRVVMIQILKLQKKIDGYKALNENKEKQIKEQKVEIKNLKK